MEAGVPEALEGWEPVCCSRGRAGQSQVPYEGPRCA